MSSIGIMDEGYFVSRREIYEWIKATLGIVVTSLEQLGKGDIYCRLLDHFHSGCLVMSKVVMSPRMDLEILMNLKHLQNGMDKAGIRKKVEITKIAKCKPLDNLQFSQWFKRTLQLEAIKPCVTQTQPQPHSRPSLGGSRPQKPKKNHLMSCSPTYLPKLETLSVDAASTSTFSQRSKLSCSQRMRCVEIILQDQSISDQDKLHHLTRLIMKRDPHSSQQFLISMI